jgi:protein-S-isoprenylcysteine O-methyltransferase Ste14
MAWHPEWIKPERVTWPAVTLISIQVICIFALAFSGRVLLPGIAANLIALACLGVVLWAFFAMRGNRWGIFPEAEHLTELVEKGPFRLVRHPMYSAALLLLLLWVIYDFTVLRLMVWLVLAADLTLKTFYEEKHLTKRFPNYPDYQKRTKRLVPWVF